MYCAHTNRIDFPSLSRDLTMLREYIRQFIGALCVIFFLFRSKRIKQYFNILILERNMRI